MITIFATDSVLDVIREKVEQIILDGKIFMLTVLAGIQTPRLPYPAGGVRSPYHSPRLEPVPTGGIYVLIYAKRNKHIEEREIYLKVVKGGRCMGWRYTCAHLHKAQE
jgi:hypothetical protein